MRKSMSIAFSAALLIGSAQLAWAQKVSNVRHYPGGTWAALWGVNDAGVAVGWGDVAGGDTRMIGVALSGPNAGKWFESGVSSNEIWGGDGGGVASTGMIVGSVRDVNGEARAYAWAVGEQGGIDLGTLSGDVGSAALAINNSGTLIAGTSYRYLSTGKYWLTPVVWTPKVGSHNGQPVTTWEIHALPTGGLEQPGAVFENVTLNDWGGWGVNDLGQVAGDGYTTDGINWWEIAVVWNPTKNGKDWDIQRLPKSADFAYSEALSINNRGEIVGDVWESNALPALWKMNSPGVPAWTLSELGTLSGMREGWNVAWGINDVGDVVGVSNDAHGHWLATRWLTSDPGTAKVLGFPGQWSQAIQVNNSRIAVGTYGSDGGPQQAVAVAIH